VLRYRLTRLWRGYARLHEATKRLLQSRCVAELLAPRNWEGHEIEQRRITFAAPQNEPVGARDSDGKNSRRNWRVFRRNGGNAWRLVALRFGVVAPLVLRRAAWSAIFPLVGVILALFALFLAQWLGGRLGLWSGGLVLLSGSLFLWRK
jgi:hypothetical protein